jgi:hypothetical protein
LAILQQNLQKNTCATLLQLQQFPSVSLFRCGDALAFAVNE